MDELNENTISITIKTLCEMLNDRGYNVDSIKNITVEEIRVQLENKILDFEAKHNTRDENIFIKYVLFKPKSSDILNSLSYWVNNPEDYRKSDRFIIIL